MFPTLPTIPLFGLPIVNASARDIQANLKERLSRESKTVIFSPNAEILTKAAKDPSLHQLLHRGDLLIPDGIGTLLCARVLGTPLTERIPGIDLGEWVLRYAAEQGLSVFLLGGKPGVARRAAERLRSQLPELIMAGTHHGYFSPGEEENVLRKVQQAEPQILLVCMGFPEQEQWILSHEAHLPSLRLAMGLGGSLDVWSGDLPRAPQPIRAMGLEWLYRALRSPQRLPRLRFLFSFFPALFRAKKQSLS
ncbi:MAG: WecB/TagA/CpsF family glycosyltransferase [Clostridia bacterium]|nr:WecB/TagA/CpsF family glycosyltransferase [Clostridia bacterium]